MYMKAGKEALYILYRLLEAGEVDGEGALVGAGAEGGHGDVGDGGDDYEAPEPPHEHRREQMP